MSNDETANVPLRCVDMHFHVGVRGDKHPEWGGISERMRGMSPNYDVFLLYAGIERGKDHDDELMRRTIDVISSCSLDRVVCLALDHVYDKHGTPTKDLSDFWVANEYVVHLRDQIEQRGPPKVLYGASVHPYDPRFKNRVAECVADGAVLLKWLPSSQQFTLADPKVREALKFLATAKEGKPLPLLLHTGVEYAVPTTHERTRPYDFLSWGWWDRFWNFWRFGKRWYTPNIQEVLRTIDEGLEAGCVIILAHCGLPYFAARWLRWLEHDDLPTVQRYLRRTAAGQTGAGRCYADVSACATPFRKDYFKKLARLPRELLLFGSDFPTPVFELSADLEEVWRDFKAMLRGDLWRIAVPQDNAIDVNYWELSRAFPGHPMFTNFDRYLW